MIERIERLGTELEAGSLIDRELLEQTQVVVLETGFTVLEGLAAELRTRADIKNFYLGESGIARSQRN